MYRDTHVCVWIHVFVYGHLCLSTDARVCVWIDVFGNGYTCLCTDARVCVWIHVYGYTIWGHNYIGP